MLDKQSIFTMLDLQDRMNSKVHDRWIEQNFEWYRAVWIECGELMDHQGYKWWKKQQPDTDQVQLEVIDIWHFGMSALFRPEKPIEQLAEEIHSELVGYTYSGASVHEATESVAAYSLANNSFSVTAFWDLLIASGLDGDSLVERYVGKNVLNFFRQDHGYKDGSYIKLWEGREDNEHLVEVVATLDASADNFPDLVYQGLAARYPG